MCARMREWMEKEKRGLWQERERERFRSQCTCAEMREWLTKKEERGLGGI